MERTDVDGRRDLFTTESETRNTAKGTSMRKRNGILTAAIGMMATGLLATSGQASISGSDHDFGSLSWSKNQICLPCHTPHNATVFDAGGAKVGGPLWNHQLSVATYTLNNASWSDPTAVPTTGDVDSNSRLCLSCHDGTVAPDSFGGGAASATMSGGVLGTDLSNDHPMGAAAVWVDASYMVAQSLRDTAHIMPLRALPSGDLAVGCTSCHEPHNRKGTENMLWVNNSGPGTTVDGRAVSGSTLCMNCHKK